MQFCHILFELFVLGTIASYVESSIPTSPVDSSGKLVSSTCHDYKDCQVSTSPPELVLPCYYNVNKCHCWNSFESMYHLGVVGNQCLMSKYGPCGSNRKNTFSIGCADNFQCIDGRCRDPEDPLRTVKDVYKFPVASCDACGFADDLQLQCSRSGPSNCLCKVTEIADEPPTFWDIRNYDGKHNCSVGEHGPCGVKDGVTIGCHGSNIECVNGRCRNATKANPLSSIGESCARNVDCMSPLVCAANFSCIRANSVPTGGRCAQHEECKTGNCGWNSEFDEFNASECKEPE